MMRVERLVTPEAKSFCSTRSVRLPARAHSRATATPLIPPPMMTTWNVCPSSEARGLSANVIEYQIVVQQRDTPNTVLSFLKPSPFATLRHFKSALPVPPQKATLVLLNDWPKVSKPMSDRVLLLSF